ncbi:MAG TPA: UDP-N-acetylglucosamine 1-carboxyvinyltransferase [Victivallales bacterium]|nr:UDP-N-acetylglucosamine 1-carboxyvinyltransferase [Victivallales bacterium]HRU00407.1 UDP-N-acetylglucosamine 1-carboxyvinyltransferase [Victivallales bacterium]
MFELIIEGGSKLSGELKVSGNKNAALPMIAASILTDQELIIHNVPDILDVKNMIEIASLLGVESTFTKGTLRLNASNIKSNSLDQELSSRLRASILFVGPILARTFRVNFFSPGGDRIGRRRLDAHIYGFKCLGASFFETDNNYLLEAKNGLKGRELFFDEPSVTATENVLMAAVLSKGRTIMRNTASEPHVVELGQLLIKMGAKISGLGSDTLIIDGVEKLNGAEWTIGADHIEAGSFIALATATGSDLKINGTKPSSLWMTRRIFEKFNAKFELKKDFIRVPPEQKLKINQEIGNAIPVISDGPWPQFPTDMMSCTIVMATQARGTVMFFEKMFESRIFFVDSLISMGVNAVICDSHRVIINGPSQLHPTELKIPDIRAGMAMVIAALCAKGKSNLRYADILMRGYENLFEKLKSLNAKIELKKC